MSSGQTRTSLFGIVRSQTEPLGYMSSSYTRTVWHCVKEWCCVSGQCKLKTFLLLLIPMPEIVAQCKNTQSLVRTITQLQVDAGYFDMQRRDHGYRTKMRGFNHSHVLGLIGVCIDHRLVQPHTFTPSLHGQWQFVVLSTKRKAKPSSG